MKKDGVDGLWNQKMCTCVSGWEAALEMFLSTKGGTKYGNHCKIRHIEAYGCSVYSFYLRLISLIVLAQNMHTWFAFCQNLVT